MKKIFASVLAIVMVLAVASSAMAAFTWNAGTSTTSENFANRYKIEVVKLALNTGIAGSTSLIEAPAATAVNSAPVYFYVRLTVGGASVTGSPAVAASDADDVQKNAEVSVSFTGLDKTPTIADKSLANFGNGVYYLTKDGKFETISDTVKPVFEATCLDTATAKVSAKVTSKTDLDKQITAGDYFINVATGSVTFADKAAAPDNTVVFNRNSNGKVTSVTATVADAQFVAKLYVYLGVTAADISDGKVYMSDDNLRAALGFNYKGESSITWNANPTAIILDPAVGVGIPKTGDNASVIGFAMVMIAVIGAAVAMKKVQA